MTDRSSCPAAPAGARRGYAVEELRVGMTADLSRAFAEDDLHRFAALCGAHNPLHFDDACAADAGFGGRIVHGALTAGLISTLLGTRLPGPGSIYLSQSLRFRAPVHVGETVVVRATVTEVAPERRRVGLRTVCSVGDVVVIDGEAVVLVPARGAGDPALESL